MNTKSITLYVTLTIILLTSGCAKRSSVDDGPPLWRDPSPRKHNKTVRPHPLRLSRYGNPSSYTVAGKRYFVLKTANGYKQRGIASWYGRKFDGKLTSTRERYDMFAMTAASKVLPIPVFVQVTNLENGRHVTVKVNDRGPFHPNRILDVSYAAARKLGFLAAGTARVEVKAITFKNNRPAVSATLHDKRYLQIGAFKNRSNAIKLKKRLTNCLQQNILVNTKTKMKDTVYLVQVPIVNDQQFARLKSFLRNFNLDRSRSKNTCQ